MGAVLSIRRGKNAEPPKNEDFEWMLNRAHQILTQLPDPLEQKLSILDLAAKVAIAAHGLKPA